MKKVIVTLRDAPNVSVEVPAEFPQKRRKRGEKAEKPKKIDRSVFGAIRLFPGVPKTISADELEFVRVNRPTVFGRLDSRPYVESKRIDYRGVTEGEVEALAEKEGIGHLDFSKKLERLGERGKISKRVPRKPAPIPAPKKSEDGKTGRKPK